MPPRSNSAGIGVLLYGAPATGKDTVTAELIAADRQFEHFQPLKYGSGRTAGYRSLDLPTLRALSTEETLWRTDAYGSTYIIDKTELQTVAARSIPIVHLGDPRAVSAVKVRAVEIDWLTVELVCPRPIAVARITERATGDTTARIARFDQTAQLTETDLRIDTAATTASAAAQLIRRACSQRRPSHL